MLLGFVLHWCCRRGLSYTHVIVHSALVVYIQSFYQSGQTHSYTHTHLYKCTSVCALLLESEMIVDNSS